jgi:hypothetical protein
MSTIGRVSSVGASGVAELSGAIERARRVAGTFLPDDPADTVWPDLSHYGLSRRPGSRRTPEST